MTSGREVTAKRAQATSHFVRFFGEGTACLLALSLLVSLVVSVAVLCWRFWRDPGGLSLGMSIYLPAATLLLFACSKAVTNLSAKTYIICLSVVSLSIKLPFLLLSGSYQQSGDYAGMYRYGSILYEQGIDSPWLKVPYDSALYFDRVLPFFLPVRAFFAGHAVFAIQAANCLLATGSILLTYRICRHAFGEGVGRWAGATLLLFPVHTLDVLNVTHDIPGVFLFLLALLLGIHLLALQNHARTVWMSIALGVIVFAVKLQRGTHQMLILFLACMAIFTCLSRSKEKGCVRIVLWSVVVPMVVLGLLSAGFDHLKSVHGINANYSRFSFLAQGWNVQTGGEYDWTLERIDIAAPPDLKDRTQQLRRYL